MVATQQQEDPHIWRDLIARHRQTLDNALESVRTRVNWSPYSEDYRTYGKSGKNGGAGDEGETQFRRLLGRPWDVAQPGRDGTVGPGPDAGGERSPYGPELGISYPHSDPDALLPAMTAAIPAWRDAGPEVRAAVCVEILHRINMRSPEFTYAAMHTSGHNPVMAFHAGAVHAQDRGLEAVAHAYAEQTRLPAAFRWRKPLGDGTAINLDKTFTAVPLGIALVVAGSVFPAWNSYAGLFASLATGNAVLVKPHPAAVLPLALTVSVAREALGDAGFAPDLVCLAAEHPGERLAASLATRPEIRIVDYAGGRDFGDWLTGNARQARVHTATSAVNTLLVESTADYRDMLANLAFSVSLYSGQLCTSPQNVLIPRAGIATDEGHKTYDQVVDDLGAALGDLLADDAAAAAVLGALLGPAVLARVERAMSGALGKVAAPTRAVRHPEHPDAVIRTPVLVRLDAARPADRATLLSEWLGPVVFAVAVGSPAEGIDLMAHTNRTCGALSVGVYTRSRDVEEAAEKACLDTGVMLSVNLMGNWYISQSAVYSDLHGTALNPAANSVHCDAAFVAGRFRFVGVRRYGGAA
ncbi:phenylacetic acid degradation protein PaaN [Streptomyces johnsoniae]|uniref:Phenylacetic acid degradation protein PaaN n=1 Tax=Streptomyces johnsoniae TaxID=3075532 RepID=A0ABU2S906_9ACTN|nr:phenylacetic acid degradation protein PaaN [Streptomyces sp. DSM 41886]MDT0445156.1 phenylacetic acid degradation protein PaaN [Streptomyces sp. DSM 41886]